MHKRHFISLLCPIVLLFLIVSSGCSTTKSLVSKVKKEKPYLKKKVMVFPPVDHSGLPSGKAAEISESLVALLEESPRLLFYRPDDILSESLSLSSEVKTTKFGVAYYHPALAKMAKDRNMNVLVAAYLPPIETTRGRAGIWPLRYDAEIYKISMIINAMDVTNGCLYITKFDSEEVAFKSKDNFNKDEALNEALTEAMPKIVKRQASVVVKSLDEESWTGRILDINKGVIKINAGKDVGVLPDQLFSVYSEGESILCRTGRSIAPLSRKLGKIKTISVQEQYSLAAPESGGPFLANQTIMFIPQSQ
jgi:hypothetical protein